MHACAPTIGPGARDLPILIVDANFHSERTTGVLMRRLAKEIELLDFRVVNMPTCADAASMAGSLGTFSCILLSSAPGEHHTSATPDPPDPPDPQTSRLLAETHEPDAIPVFFVGERISAEMFHRAHRGRVKGVLNLLEDTPARISQRVVRAAQDYLDGLLPPFFRAMVRRARGSSESWHTPGHAGGAAFMTSPVGRAFHRFYGENLLRTDLSVSVPELGSLLDHKGPIHDAEVEAARTFGADHTFFVVNGNSTANKIVWHGTVCSRDVVVVDRNCHKSIMHSVIMTGAIPVYFVPSRNEHGIIGPISVDQFSAASVAAKIAANPLAREHGDRSRLAVVTNSTYDGIVYNTEVIKNRMAGAVDALHFDEAWSAYNAFHEFYAGHYGMFDGPQRPEHPMVFATQSTHKLLAALSQAAMVHVKNSPRQRLDAQRFNDAFAMHTSTSPSYPIMASLDVASHMMAGRGRALLTDAMHEAITFRRMLRDHKGHARGDWWFKAWQPDDLAAGDEAPSPEHWQLRGGERWHGFIDVTSGATILDPLKVTLLCPGADGAQDEVGVPAVVAAKYLWERGITVEKTGLYSLLFLFTIGVTRGKCSRLLTELMQFKRLHAMNAPLDECLPSVAPRYARRGLGLRDLCEAIHRAYREHRVLQIVREMYLTLPEPVMRPTDAYEAMVRGHVERLDLSATMGRVSAAMVAPTPPGIPVIVPGERFPTDRPAILDYLRLTQEFARRFPGFETEIHGVRVDGDGANRRYLVDCVMESCKILTPRAPPSAPPC